MVALTVPRLVGVLFAVCHYAVALNDWSQPCFDGECAYDLPAASGVSGILKLFGEPKGLTDITPAAGWVILDCDPNVLNQDIRLVCETDHDESGCQHIFDYHGAHNKIVRLPENCGHGPFARLVNMRVADDQSLPLHAQGRISRRDGSQPQVHVLSIDQHLAKIDHSLAGDAKFAFVGVNHPGIDLNEAFADGIFDDIGKWFSNVAHSVAHAVSSALKWVTDKIQDLGELIKDKTKVDIEPTVTSPNISLTADIDVALPLHGIQDNGCHEPPLSSVVVHSKGWLQLKAGIIVIGHILPLPAVTKFAAFGGIDGDLDAKVHIDLNMKMPIQFHKNILTAPVIGFTIPGLVNIGLNFILDGMASGVLELDVKADAHLKYKFDQVVLWYPAEDSKGKSSEKGITNDNSDINFKMKARVEAEAVVRATISPSLHVGVDILGGAVGTGVYVAADAFVEATMAASLKAKGGVSLYGKKPKFNKRAIVPLLERADATNTNTPQVQDRSYVPPYGLVARKTLEDRAIKVGFTGCLWIDLGVKLRAGGYGNLLNMHGQLEYTIWESPKWEVFAKCWSAGTIQTTVSKKPSWDFEMQPMSSRHMACDAMVDSEITDNIPNHKWK
ncbi:hypothetical protein ONZ45_g9566 [Pleurotus djamor]|nr:hypothetical protein ONZ45_g9566 [Pleurotus djamor]